MKSTTIRAVALYAMLTASGWVSAHNEKEGHSHDSHAIGMAGALAKVTRTINIDMSDAMRFTPANVQAKQGETIRFVVKNSGRIKHEFALGTAAALKEHYELMRKFPEMEHSEPNMVTVLPGQTGEVIWQFTRSGKIDFACLQAGHYDAGMKGVVMVMEAKKSGHDAMTMDNQVDHQH